MKATSSSGRQRGRPPVKGITESQRKVLEEIRSFINRKGFPPTVKDLSGLIKISPASVHEHISKLAVKGYLRREAHKARSLEVLAIPPIPSTQLVAIPVVGTVPAGKLLLAEQNIEGEILVEKSLVRSGTYFALKVKGESMLGAGIRSGDYVVVRQQPVAESGEIIVARVNDEATVKRLYVHDDHIELRPENSTFRSIRVDPGEDVFIAGKVVAIHQKERE